LPRVLRRQSVGTADLPFLVGLGPWTPASQAVPATPRGPCNEDPYGCCAVPRSPLTNAVNAHVAAHPARQAGFGVVDNG